MRYLNEILVRRWGRVNRPVEDAGSFVMIELETRDPRYPPPPTGALRLWHRRPGAADDDDLLTWTVWFHGDAVGDWIGPNGRYEVDEWLPDGVEPDWSTNA